MECKIELNIPCALLSQNGRNLTIITFNIITFNGRTCNFLRSSAFALHDFVVYYEAASSVRFIRECCSCSVIPPTGSKVVRQFAPENEELGTSLHVSKNLPKLQS